MDLRATFHDAFLSQAKLVAPTFVRISLPCYVPNTDFIVPCERLSSLSPTKNKGASSEMKQPTAPYVYTFRAPRVR